MRLDVHLHGERVGSLERCAEGCVFAYDPRAVERFDAGKTPLSHSLPLRAEPFGPEATRAYVEGLLPQGERRHRIAAELGLDPADGYGLIAELGGDCLGAVTFQSEGEEPREPSEPAWLGEDELEEVLRSPPRRLFDPDRPQRMRFALPGERHKLALVRDDASDRWAWPEPGLPSTHILKPEPPERPGLVANEHACTLAYRELGLPVAHTAVETIAGRECLLCKRFDRWGEGPRAERLHQESFAQALGIAPGAGEGRRLVPGVPGLGEVSALLHAIGEASAVETLMKVTFCDLTIGCTELRGANAALLFGPDGPMLAPFYDIASTEIYGALRPRPIVIGIDVPPAPLLIDLRHTIELCGLEFQPSIIESVRLMGSVCVALNAVAADAHEEGWNRAAVEDALLLATRRTTGFREESEYLRPPGGER